MTDLPAEPVYLPELSVGDPGGGTVEAVEVEPRVTVKEGAVLLRVRGPDADTAVLAPFAGTVSSVYVESGAPVAPGALLASLTPLEPEQAPVSERRQRFAGRVLRWAPLTLAAGALVLPLAWLVVATLARLSSAAMARRRFGRPPPPRPIAGRIAAVLIWAVLCIVAAATLAWCGGAIAWLIREGSAGATAAGRLASFGFTLPLAALLGCWRLFAGALRRSGAGAAAAGRLARAPSPILALPLVLAPVWMAGVIAFASQENAIGMLRSAAEAIPVDGAAKWVDERRLDWALADTKRVVLCLQKHDRRGWRRITARVISPGLIRVTVFSKRRPRARSVSTLLVALGNQLAPLEPRLVVRSTAGRHRTVAAEQVTPRVTPADRPPAGRRLAAADRRVALACSATGW